MGHTKIIVTNQRTCIRCLSSYRTEGANFSYCPNCRTGRNGKRSTKFRALDGEGETIEGIHRYVLLTLGNEEPIENRDGLEFDEILTYLYSHYEENTTYIGFSLGYDFTFWLSTLPRERAWRLLTIPGKESRHLEKFGGHSPVCYLGWQFDMIGMKQFKFRRQACECLFEKGVHQRKRNRRGLTICCDDEFAPHCEHKQFPWMYINDVFPFWQSAFLKVIDPNPKNWKEPLLTAEEYTIIEEGKKKRDIAVLDDGMRRYNALENELLERVMYRIDEGFHAMGIFLTPSTYFGPGQAAEQWMINAKVPRRVDHDGCSEKCIRKHAHIARVVPDWFRMAANTSYYGGWFEQMAHGVIPGTTYEYDINSAYPHVIRNLPCMLHGEYTRGTGKPEVKDGEICLALVTAWTRAPGYHHPDKHTYIGAMPHRDDDGAICRPEVTTGWYWTHELDAARRAKCITRISDDRYREWVKYKPCDCPSPLAGVADLYELRLKWKKNTPHGKSAKLVYNSEYGKTAQSIGAAKFANPTYASLITAGCRTMILDAIAAHPEGKKAVVMVATDAVFFTSLHPSLPLSDKLGEWEKEEHEDLTLFKPGVYWNAQTLRDLEDKSKALSFKARGFSASALAPHMRGIDAQFRSWQKNPPRAYEDMNGSAWREDWPKVLYRPVFSQMTCLQALMQNKWEEAGKVTQGADCKELAQSSEPFTPGKRMGIWKDGNNIIRSNPPIYWTERDEETRPYDKKFGEESPWSEETLQQWGYTPDGYVGSELRGILSAE